MWSRRTARLPLVPAACATPYHRRVAPEPYDADVVELLALVASLEDHAFARCAADAQGAPTAEQRFARSRLAASAVSRRDRVLDRLAALSDDPAAPTAPFDQVLDDLDARTQPTTWTERLLQGYVGYGVCDDLCRLAARGAEPRSQDLVLDVLDGDDHEPAVVALSDACAHDATLASRLALWGRRVAGESLQTVSRLLESRPGLARLAVRGLLATQEGLDAPSDATLELPPAKVLNELTAEHTRRMSRLGLTA